MHLEVVIRNTAGGSQSKTIKHHASLSTCIVRWQSEALISGIHLKSHIVCLQMLLHKRRERERKKKSSFSLKAEYGLQATIAKRRAAAAAFGLGWVGRATRISTLYCFFLFLPFLLFGKNAKNF